MKRPASPKDATATHCARSAIELDFAFRYLEDEHETLLALAIALRHQLEPNDPDNTDDCDHITAWRLSQVLNRRLEETQFLKDMRRLITGVEAPEPA